MQQDVEERVLIVTRTGGEVPEIGIQCQVACRSNKTNKSLIALVDDAQLPEAATESQGPTLYGMSGLTTGHQQSINRLSARIGGGL